MKRYILLNPGPVNVSPRVQQALLRGDLCHREEEFSDLLVAIRTKLLRAFVPRDYTAVPVSGSGTLAVEAMVSSAMPEGRKLLVINNGVYGERMLHMAEAHRIPTVELRYNWTERPDLSQIESTLQADSTIHAVALVHHETTTGLLNLVNEVGAITRRAGRWLLLDAVSALASEELDMVRDGIDLCACTANKCIQGLPGVSFVLVSNAAMVAMQQYPQRSLYLHLPLHWEAQERRSIPFTPSVQAWYALDEALDELLEETVAKRIQRYHAAAHLLRDGFARLGLKSLLPPDLQSHSLTSLLLPEGMTYPLLHDGLKERGFVIYEGQGKLQTGVFRVANMGHLTLDDFRQFLTALEAILS
ncbi:MAG: aminotransferase class V-fold PLP-dependent enzyme [Deltaproteobacteria bacterium]|nr:aminotransferase class V-fold PLP-dependent enzyme [Deltaproteobacteria bacterium]